MLATVVKRECELRGMAGAFLVTVRKWLFEGSVGGRPLANSRCNSRGNGQTGQPQSSLPTVMNGHEMHKNLQKAGGDNFLAIRATTALECWWPA
jgi:hypothetical protein